MTVIPWSDEELRRKVGQLFIVGFHGHTASEDIKTLIQTHYVGAIVLFLRNVRDADQLSSLCAELQQLAKDAHHDQPLFIGIDQENGLVTRIKPPLVAQLPGPMALGATGDPAAAFEVALATSETLKHFGINMNYSPVSDINSEPKNPVIGVRSFSDDPEVVGKFVSEQIKGHRQNRIVPCIKHFPGHGDTAVDSHYGLPVITKNKAQFEECELVPFRRAVAAGVESIMTAHIAMPNLSEGSGKDLPASLSPEIMGLLRNEMKYDGMIVSDCLEMDGVRATFGTEQGAVMALKAGTDAVMICHTMSAQVGAIEQVIKAFKSGDIPQEQVEKSYNRITNLKSRYVRSGSSALSNEEFKVMNDRNAKMAEGVYAKSATLVRSSDGSIPVNSAAGKKVVFLSPGREPLPSGVVEYGEEKTRESYTPKEYLKIVQSHHSDAIEIKYFETVAMSETDSALIAAADTVILATRNATLSPYQKQIGVKLGKELGEKLVVIATCDPYDFLEDSEIKNYMTIYEPTFPAFKAATDIIFGKAPPLGNLPVTLPKVVHDIRDFDATRDIEAASQLWNSTLPKWTIPQDRFRLLLDQGHGKHFIAVVDDKVVGFCITYTTAEGAAKISGLVVDPKYQSHGVGTALMNKARAYLRSQKHFASLSIGSVFPRFWPGLPTSLPPKDRSFFRHRGFRKSEGVTYLDFYQNITNYSAPKEVLENAEKNNLSFSPWSKDLYEECMIKQRKNFSKNQPWIAAYEKAAATDNYEQVMVAFHTDPETGVRSQVGWTLACSLSSYLAEDFAFLPLLGEKTGLIACVGVDSEVRGKGVGIAMLIHAMLDMKKRGVEDVFIDWVVIRGFYEKLGFEAVWEYEGLEW